MEFSIAPKSIDHSLHLPVRVSAILWILPYLGNVCTEWQLLHLYLSVFRTFHEFPLTEWKLINKLQLSHFWFLGTHCMKSFLNHCKTDFRHPLSSISILVFLTITSGINVLIYSKICLFTYCSDILLYSTKESQIALEINALWLENILLNTRSCRPNCYDICSCWSILYIVVRISIRKS